MEMVTSYNGFLVALSFCVSVFGSYTGLQLAGGIRDASSSARPWWVFFAALALGGGAIWTMHFIGMLAYQTSVPVVYDIGITFLSLLIAVLVVGVSVYIVANNGDSMLGLLAAGLFAGLGVASMHYVGMEAMIMAADMHYDTVLVAVSIVIAVVAATVALWLSFNLTGNFQKLGSAVVMGIAVCGMHYTGMAAMSMVPNDDPMVAVSSLSPLAMGLFVFCFSMLLLVLCLIVALSQLSRRMYEAMESEQDISSETA